MFQSAGIVARYDKRNAIKLAKDLGGYIEKKGLKVYIEETLKEKMKKGWNFRSLEDMKTDLIITIGGDGTILRTCVAVPKPEPPILAINMGVRGFLTEVTPKDAHTAVERCLKGDYVMERCAKLSIKAGDTIIPDALNEVLIAVDEPVKLLYARVSKNGEHVLDCQADGLMVATQTGSTGYSLSAGGPVLDPNVDAFVFTPICSLSVLRSIVFPSNSKITISVLRPKRVMIVVDGAYRHILESETPCVTVTRSNNWTTFIRFRENFYNRLRSRLIFRGFGGKI